MESKTFVVPGISCAHCVHTIKMELGEVPGVQKVDADMNTKVVTVEWTPPADWETVRKTLVEINYPPEGLISLS